MNKHIWGLTPSGKIDTAKGKEVFRKHNENVLRVAKEKGREVLVYRVGDGWERLCGFLGKQAPLDGEGKEKGFPRSDDWREWKEEHKGCAWDECLVK